MRIKAAESLLAKPPDKAQNLLVIECSGMVPQKNINGAVGVMGRVVAAATHAFLPGISSANGHASRQSALQHAIECLMPRLKLAVVFGGNKEDSGSVLYRSQNTRSWKSYEAVAEDIAASLRRSGFKHVSVMPEDMNLAERLQRDGIHMAWLNTGGVQGRNSSLMPPPCWKCWAFRMSGTTP